MLVTGGAGFIGSHLVDALLARQYRVRVLDSLRPQVHGPGVRPPAYLDPRAEFLHGNVLDEDTVARALDGVSAVYHLAAQVGVAQSMYEIASYCRENVAGTGVLLAAIVRRRAAIRKLVVASSMSLYGEGAYRAADGGVRCPGPRARPDLARGAWEPRDPAGQGSLAPLPTPETKPLAPTSVYAVTKRDQEELCLAVGAAYRIPTLALRYFNVYGTRQSLDNPYTGVAAIFASRLLNGRPPVIFEDGLQTRDFVHVSDVVHANLLALETSAADYQAINVGTGEPTTILAFARLLAKELGVLVDPEVTGRFREGDVRHCVADIDAARRLLGYEPRVRVAQGIPALIGWVRSQVAHDHFDEARRELAQHGLA